MRTQILRVLVTVKAYPAISKRHGETVCVAGIDIESGRWVRLYPVPFRDLSHIHRFTKFDIIQVSVRKAADPRPESYEPNADSIAVVDHVGSEEVGRRRRYIDPLMRASMCEIRRDQAASRISLGVFRPSGPPELTITEDSSEWEPDKQMIVDQPSMLMPGKQGLEKVPYRFSYRYMCADEPECHGHDQSIIDWEVGEAYRKWRAKVGEKQALDDIRTKWERTVWAKDRDTSIFTGNQFKNPDGFLVLGVFWPRKRATGGGPSAPVQGELLPPR